jgi:hypothetical protein
MKTELSPAAQAVLDAAVLPCTTRQGIAAALRAAADQARSQKITRSDWIKQTWVLQSDILSIADELETQP